MEDARHRPPEAVPALSERECDDFVNWLLSDIAYSDSGGKRGQRVLLGRHIQRQGDRHLRGSDQTERIYIAATVMIANGRSQKEACVFIASNPNVRLGKSRRGRPPKSASARDLVSNAQTVRAILNSFQLCGPPNKVSELVWHFRWLRENGIVEGSQYVSDSGRRVHEAWRRAMLRVGIDPDRHEQ